MHRYDWTATRPHKMGIVDDNFCWKCKNMVSTYLHMFHGSLILVGYFGQFMTLLGNRLCSTLPKHLWLCLLDVKAIVPCVTNNKFTKLVLSQQQELYWETRKYPDL